MIYCLTGKVVKKTLDTVVISCAGVGYLATVPASVSAALPGAGGEATLYTVMNVTENDVSLFGFESEAQRESFLLLTGVSGVGPKVGVAILNVLTPDRVALAISAGDHKAFTAANGVGPKLAQRIAMELKDKAPAVMALGGALTVDPGPLPDAEVIETPAPTASRPARTSDQGAQATADALSALGNLGYGPSEAARAVAEAAGAEPGAPTPALIRAALRLLAPKE